MQKSNTVKTLGHYQNLAPMGFPGQLLENWLTSKGIKFVKKPNGWLLMKCILPNHTDNNPSFNLHPVNGGFNCWGCARKGNWESLCEIMNWSAAEAPQHTFLHDVDSSDSVNEMIRSMQPTTSNGEHNCHLPQGYKKLMLGDAQCFKHIAYLNRRNLVSSIKQFEVGYTIDSDVIYNRMFVNRLIIPVHDENGKMIWPEGRAIFDSITPKYYRPANTQKQNLLFNLHRVKRQNYVFLVEGMTDVMQLHIWGVPAVCNFGTAISKEQIRLITKYFDKVYLAFDNDAAGRAGYDSNIEFLRKIGIEIWKFTLPIKKDFNALTYDKFQFQFQKFSKKIYG